MPTDANWLQELQRKYPDGILFADDYRELPRVFKAQYLALRCHAKKAGFKDIREWLISKNRYIDMERDMYVPQERYNALSADQLEAGVKAVFRDFALLGQRVLPPAFAHALIDRAQTIFNYIIGHDTCRLTALEQEILTLTIIQRMKDQGFQEGEEKSFWRCIYAQFGFKPAKEDSDTENRLYGALHAAVKDALQRNNRYFISEKVNAHRYYTSLKLHALAPVISMENLFEILLTFYIDDLDACYIPGDAAFAAVVSALASRWDKSIERDDEFHIRSNEIYSGMRVLFSQRKSFMRSFCQRIVCRIDALVHQPSHALNNEDYLDVLLQRWYAKRALSPTEVQKQRTRNSGMVSNASALRLCYALEHGRVVLKIPAIRLDDVKSCYPHLQLLQCGTIIHEQEMDTYGRLVWTTRAISLALQETKADFDQLDSLQVRIQYENEIIYDSADRLNRDYILFDQLGSEISRQRVREGGRYCLLAGDAASITWAEDTDVYFEDHRGQLCEIRLSEKAWVKVNGQDIWMAKDRRKTFKHAASVDKVRHIWAVEGGQQYTLYPAAFSMHFDLPEGDGSAKYEIGVDEQWSPLISCCPHGGTFCLSAPSEPEKPHCIQFRQITDHRVLYEYRYMVIPGLRIGYDKLCFDNGKPIPISIKTNTAQFTFHVLPDTAGDELLLPLTDSDYDFRIKLPLVRCSIGTLNGLALPEALWHEEIAHDSFIHVDCPPQWHCSVAVGAAEVPPSSDRTNWYELGNFLRTHHSIREQEPLFLAFRSDNEEPILHQLTTLQFKEHFLHSPLYIDEHRLLYQPDGCYIGPANAELVLYIDISNEEQYQYALCTKELDAHFPHDGCYAARIVRKEKSIFGKGAEITLWEETLQFGVQDSFRFHNKYLHPVEARCWDLRSSRYRTIPLNSDYLCIHGLTFVGYSKPCEEDSVMPEYTACCSYYDMHHQQWCEYNRYEHASSYEWVNPVRVWIANDQVLTMKCASDDVVMVDTRYGAFINRKLSRSEENQYMQMPDYIMYRLEE